MSKHDLAAAAGISLTTAKRGERGLPVRFPTGHKVLAVCGEKPSPELERPVFADQRSRSQLTIGPGHPLGCPGPVVCGTPAYGYEWVL